MNKFELLNSNAVNPTLVTVSLAMVFCRVEQD